MNNIFQTSANLGLNSFQSPMNPFNSNPGNWDVNPYYITPSYTAPYRPDQGGEYGYNPYSMPAPSMGQSFNRVFNPLANESPFSSNYTEYNARAFDKLGYAPSDAVVQGLQSLAVPLAGVYAANQVMKWNTTRQNAMSQSIMEKFHFAKGMSGTAAAEKAARQGMFSAVFDKGAQGVVRGMFGAGRAISKAGILGDAAWATKARMGMQLGAGVVGGAAGWLAPQILVAQGAMMASQAMVFDPYIAARQGAEYLKEDLSEIHFGTEHGGNVVTGKGLSAVKAQQIGNALVKANFQDFAFKTGDYAKIADLSARSGLLNTVTSPDQIVGEVSKIADQVKLVMAVAKDSSVVEAVKVLADLRKGGANNVIQAGSAFNDIGMSAAIAGVSAKKLYDTVGTQGQVLFSQNGLVPYIGAMAAANSYASFAAAQRTGRIGQDVLASMGGVEGASQSYLAGQVNAAQTNYNMFRLHNKYMSNNPQAGVVSNLLEFNSAYVKDPTNVSGLMALNKGQMISEDMKDGRGIMNTMTQVAEIAKQYGPASQVYKDGKIKAGTAYQIMVGTMGLPADQASAIIRGYMAQTDPEVHKHTMDAIQGHSAEMRRTFMSQNGLYFGNPAMIAMRQGWKNAKEAVAPTWEGTAELGAGASDWLTKKMDYLRYGVTPASDGPGVSIDEGESSLEALDRMPSQESMARIKTKKGAGKIMEGLNQMSLRLLNPLLRKALTGSYNPTSYNDHLESINSLASHSDKATRDAARRFISSPSAENFARITATKGGAEIFDKINIDEKFRQEIAKQAKLRGVTSPNASSDTSGTPWEGFRQSLFKAKIGDKDADLADTLTSVTAASNIIMGSPDLAAYLETEQGKGSLEDLQKVTKKRLVGKDGKIDYATVKEVANEVANDSAAVSNNLDGIMKHGDLDAIVKNPASKFKNGKDIEAAKAIIGTAKSAKDLSQIQRDQLAKLVFAADLRLTQGTDASPLEGGKMRAEGNLPISSMRQQIQIQRDTKKGIMNEKEIYNSNMIDATGVMVESTKQFQDSVTAFGDHVKKLVEGGGLVPGSKPIPGSGQVIGKEINAVDAWLIEHRFREPS